MTGRAVAVAVVLGLGGCGGGPSPARESVSGYLEAANAVQKDSARAFRQANRSYVRFARGKLKGDAAPPALAEAERAIAGARDELGELEPPPEARRLHRLLLRVYELNEGLAGETVLLARYVPARADALRDLPRRNRRLGDELAAAKTPAAQEEALARFARGLASDVKSLRELRPPPVARSGHRVQLRRLEITQVLARRLRAAVADRDTALVARLLVRFRRVGEVDAAARRLGRRDAREYGRRYRAIGQAVAAVALERARLQKRL